MKRLRLIIISAAGLVIIVTVAALIIWRTDLYTSIVSKIAAELDKPAQFQKPTDANEVAVDVNEPNEPSEPNKPVEADKPGEPNEPNEPIDPNNQLEALNLKDVEMKDIIKKLADWTGKVIIPTDEAMKQKITIYSPKELPRSEALSHIYSALYAKGFIAEHSDGVIYLKPITEAKLGSVPTIPADQPLATIENRNQVVQKFFKLKSYSPTQMGDIIMPLVGEYGYVSVDENTGSLLVIETVENLMRFERIIAQFDVPGAEQTMEKIFVVRYGDPAEIVQLLRKLLGQETTSRVRGGSRRRGAPSAPSRPSPTAAGGPSKTDKAKADQEAASVVIGSTQIPIVLIPEPKRKWIIARASAEDIKQIGEWIEKLDREEPAQLESETVSIDYVDVREVANQLNQALQEMPGTELRTSVLVQPLIQARQILIFGRTEIREMVKKLIEEIDVPSGDFETRVFKLEYADPDEIKENLEGLYEKQAGRYSSYGMGRYSYRNVEAKDTVKVISFPMMQQVTVIASPENMIKIAEQIAEWDVALDVEKVKPLIITLHNSDPVKMAELLTTLFSEESSGRMSFWDYYFGSGEERKKIVGPLYGQLTFEAVPDTKKIIVISKIPEAYRIVEELIHDLDKQEMAEVPKVITLNYADPEDLAVRLNAMFNEPGTVAPIWLSERGLSEYSMEETDDKNKTSSDEKGDTEGQYTPPWSKARPKLDEMSISNVIGRIRFIPDPRSKSMLVLAPPEFMDSIEEMINELDTPGKQVMIKAIIVEVDHSNMTSLGLQLSSDNTKWATLDNENAITSLTRLSLLEERGSLILNTATEVTALIDFLVKKVDAKILNQQTLWTKDNEEAEFFKGDRVAFLKGSTISPEGRVTSQNVEFERVGMVLRTRPSITPEKNVDMIINVILWQLTSDTVNNQPVRTGMETETNMIVQDGQTIMLGGILFQKDSTIERKLPLFGDVPLFGGLFRHEEVIEANKEMLVFITPYVIDETGDMLPETIEEIEAPKEKLESMLEQLEAAIQEDE